MRNKLLLTLLTALVSLTLQAQTLLRGTVKDPKGGAIIGATIQLKGTTTGTTSDQDGAYQLRTVQGGTVQLMASFVGSKTEEKTVTLSGSEQTVNFTLADDVFNLDQVVVTGTGTTRTQKEMSASLTQLNSRQIQATSLIRWPIFCGSFRGFMPKGGGEVAANIFVRGLPAGGQYKYNPIEEDGMPVQSTGYLTSSAQDIYFRNDLGVASMEFARGGSTSLFGMGAPLGVFNYISKKGGPQAETTVKFSGGQYNLYRMDFNHGGPAGENWTYNVSGFYRYDEGPLPTGLATKGYQIRANATRRIEGGYFRFYIRALNDNDQFYLPIPHVKNTATAATGNDGEQIRTLSTPYAGTFGLVTPLGTVQGNIGNGVTVRGNSIMLEFVKNLGNNWEVQAKTRWSNFAHTFDLWSPNKSYELGAYAKMRVPAVKNYTYTYTDNGLPLNLAAQGINEGRTYVTEETITLRNRPMQDYTADLRLSKHITTDKAEHNLTFGLFGSVTKQLQDEYGTGILVDFANQPRLVDLVVTDTTGKTVRVTKDGFRQSIAGRTNNSFEADRIAFYVGDEMVFGKLRFDVGFRHEWQKGKVTVENTAAYTNPTATGLADATYRWGTGKTTYREVTFNDFSFVLGSNYRLSNSTNLYASFAKGVYFPELRLFSNIARDAKGNFIQTVPSKNENVYQAEVGVKYGASRLSGTAAAYYNTIKNRLQQDVEAGSDGTLREITRSVGSTTTFGLEAAAAYQLARGWTVDGELTLQDHRHDDYVKNLAGPDNIYGTADDSKQDYRGNWVLRQPKFMLNGGLSYTTSVWDLGVMANHVGKRFADDQNNIELPAYTLINLRAYRTILTGARQSITLGLNLYNAFNSRGLTEGDPRVGDTNTILNDPFYNARPILPRRLTGSVTFKF